MKVLITGCHGFMATHLARMIRSRFPTATVVGTSRNESRSDYLDHVYKCDHSNQHDNIKLFQQFTPDVIYHLAAQSYVSSSWEDPASTYQTNIIGTEYLLHAIFHQLPNHLPRFIFASSSEVYEYTKGNLITEDSPLSPRSPYGISKLACEYIIRNYFLDQPSKLIIFRLFNHSGPGRPPIFIDTKTAFLIAKAEIRQNPLKLEFRTLNATRDFLDYRDVVSAYIECIKSPHLFGTFNICSSIPITLTQLVSSFTQKSDLPITVSESLLDTKQSDGGFLVGNNQKVLLSSRWKPQYDYLQETTQLIIEDARQNQLTASELIE